MRRLGTRRMERCVLSVAHRRVARCALRVVRVVCRTLLFGRRMLHVAPQVEVSDGKVYHGATPKPGHRHFECNHRYLGANIGTLSANISTFVRIPLVRISVPSSLPCVGERVPPQGHAAPLGRSQRARGGGGGAARARRRREREGWHRVWRPVAVWGSGSSGL